MAAITNQNTRKQLAMQRAEGLTDIWDVFKAWMGRAAEIVLTLCMFAQLIGMLPGVAYPGWANNTILGIQIIMLDFGAFALAPLAEQARNIGQDEAAKKAEDMATFLIRLVILTMVIIIVGQFSAIFGTFAKYITGFVKYAEPALILVRVASVVKYIHVIHSLRSSTTLEIEPTQPIQNEKVAQLEETISGLKEQFSTVIKALETNSSIQLPTQPTHDLYTSIQPVEEPTHEFQTLMAGLSIITDVAKFATGVPIVDQDVPMIEAAHKPVEQIVYPSVQGVSEKKVREIIDAHLSGTGWRDITGNYSQTIKPVRDAWESLHTSTH